MQPEAMREVRRHVDEGISYFERRAAKMPGGDRTGPMGMGPMTGRGAGYCAGLGMPGYANPAPGRGFGMGGGRGRGFGAGRGFRHRYYATGLPGWMRFGGWPAPYAATSAATDEGGEKQWLEAQARSLQGELEEIKKRLQELESGRAEGGA
jgi:hypothetical protein